MPLNHALLLPGAAAGGTPGTIGLTLPTAGANVNDGGNTAWTSTGNIVASDNNRSTCNRSSTGTSQWLYASGFDFSGIPAGATITRVFGRIERDYSSTGTATVTDAVVQLTKDGTTVFGANAADTVTAWIKGTDTLIDYEWTTSLPTRAELQAAAFGLIVKATITAPTAGTNARVDAVWLGVDYLA